MDLAGVLHDQIGAAGQHAHRQVGPVDPVRAVDHLVQDDVAVGIGPEVGVLKDALEIQAVVVQVAGRQEVAPIGQVDRGPLPPGRFAELRRGVAQKADHQVGVFQVGRVVGHEPYSLT